MTVTTVAVTVFETFIGARRSATVMPPFVQKLQALKKPFAFFVYFAVRFINTGILKNALVRF